MPGRLRSPVPLQVWWSPRDRIVLQQPRQSARFVQAIRKLNPKADIVGYTGGWRHSAEMRAKTRLPFALATFGLLPERYERARGVRVFRRVTAGPGSASRTSAPRPRRPIRSRL